MVQIDESITDESSGSDLAFKALLLAVAVGCKVAETPTRVSHTVINPPPFEALWLADGTNFPVGRLMNDALPAAATTSGRFTLAALALSPFIPRLEKRLVVPAVVTGLCDAVGYCAQSLALVDTPAAKVSFLGALTVVWVPCLSLLLRDGKRLGLASAPQVWLAALLTLAGLGFLEMGGSSLEEVLAISPGDAWSVRVLEERSRSSAPLTLTPQRPHPSQVVQALGFGTSFYLIGALLGDDDTDADQVLPLTAVNLATVAAFAALWAVGDGCGLGPLAASPSAGWLLDEASRAACALPGVVLGPVGGAFLWTGLVSTALVRVAETYGLSRVPQADAAVLVATEPLWASIFGVMLLSEGLGLTEALGGALVMLACVVSSAEPDAVRAVLPMLPRDVQHEEVVEVRGGGSSAS
jgi:drug/metabolite transporter (DMT)-like permease